MNEKREKSLSSSLQSRKSKRSTVSKMESSEKNSDKAIQSESQSYMTTKNSDKDERMVLLKLLHYHHELIETILSSQCRDALPKNEIYWIETTFNECYDKFLEKIQTNPSFSSINFKNVLKNIKSWNELKKKFESDIDLLNFEKEHINISSNIKDKEIGKKDNLESSNATKPNPKQKETSSWASSSDRPRRSCTLKRSTDSDSKQPDEKKRKLAENNNKNKDEDNDKPKSNEINKKVEELVINCDPFNCLPGTSKSDNNNKIASNNASNSNQPSTSTDVKQAQLVPLKIVDGKFCLPIESNKINISNITSKPLATTNQINIITKTNGTPSVQPQIFQIQSPQVINNQPVKGKVLLINSVPFLVRNGNQVQLPIIPANTINSSGMKNTDNNNNNSNKNSITQIKEKVQTKNIPEVIKIEDDPDDGQCSISKTNNNNNINNKSNKVSIQSSMVSDSNTPTRQLSTTTTPCLAAIGGAKPLQNKVIFLKNSMVSPLSCNVVLANSNSSNPSSSKNLINVPFTNLPDNGCKTITIPMVSSNKNPNVLFKSPQPILIKPMASSKVSQIPQSNQSATTLSRNLNEISKEKESKSVTKNKTDKNIKNNDKKKTENRPSKYPTRNSQKKNQPEKKS